MCLKRKISNGWIRAKKTYKNNESLRLKSHEKSFLLLFFRSKKEKKLRQLSFFFFVRSAQCSVQNFNNLNNKMKKIKRALPLDDLAAKRFALKFESSAKRKWFSLSIECWFFKERQKKNQNTYYVFEFRWKFHLRQKKIDVSAHSHNDKWNSFFFLEMFMI